MAWGIAHESGMFQIDLHYDLQGETLILTLKRTSFQRISTRRLDRVWTDLCPSLSSKVPEGHSPSEGHNPPWGSPRKFASYRDS